MSRSKLKSRLRRPIALAAVLALAGWGLLAATPAANAATTTTVAINGSSTGRTFDGVGAISGGGGNSRLLIDYPPTQRSQILDYLFKPNYGAAVQLLKLEIGGDSNSTDGAEPSIEHTRGVINCNAGYEFWLGEQAVARNPNIKLYALPWAAPGWIGGGSFWTTDMINYDLAWLNCAKQHGLTISYIGGWNERNHNKTWYENLRSALNSNGYSAVQIVGDDSDWGAADDMVKDSAFNNSVQIVGAHYPCGYLGDATSCSSTANAKATGKPLWASEFGSQDLNSGSAPYIRSITRGYLDGQMTGFLNWPLVAALYPNLPFHTDALAVAASPWSGNYSLGKSLWANAQVAQFTQPGWKFLTGSASGYLGGNRANGSYISLKSTNGTDYSTIYETTTASAAQTVNVTVSGSLKTSAVHVFSTDLGSSSSSSYFVKQADVTPSGGKYTLTLQPNRIYSVTTTTGQAKGTATSPASSSLALPYTDDYESYATGTEAKYFSDMQGAFEVQPCVAGHTGQCLQQMAPVKPIEWESDTDAFGISGDTTWSDYTVSTDVDLQQAGTVALLGRANTQGRPQPTRPIQAAYQLRISNTGAWSIAKYTSSGTLTTLTSGTHAALGLNTWHKISLGFAGTRITAALDGATLGAATDSSFARGQVGLDVVGYHTDMFDNLSVTPGSSTGGGGTGAAAGSIVGQASGRCADVPNKSQTNGTQADLWDCNGGTNQLWSLTSAKQLQVYGTKCLQEAGTADGSAVQIQTCGSATSQQWTVNAAGTIVNTGSGKCLDATGTGTANGTELEIWTCNGGSNQAWTHAV